MVGSERREGFPVSRLPCRCGRPRQRCLTLSSPFHHHRFPHPRRHDSLRLPRTLPPAYPLPPRPRPPLTTLHCPTCALSPSAPARAPATAHALFFRNPSTLHRRRPRHRPARDLSRLAHRRPPAAPTALAAMGNCVSNQDREAQQRSQEIDRQIEEDSRKFKKECKILLLGEYPLALCSGAARHGLSLPRLAAASHLRRRTPL